MTKKEAIKELKTILRPNDEIHCILRHVSKSGMLRHIGFRSQRKNRDITWLISNALDMPVNKDGDGLKVSGCGMDMGFAVVYDMSSALWPKGTRKAHGTRNGKPDNAGGYALKHVWI